jgi:hypothetical protein
MKRVPISSVEIDSAGSLFVRPKTDRSYEYIYREANGLRWDGHKRTLHAYEPARWEPAELLQHMATTLRECCDEALVFAGSTSWDGVSAEMQNDLRNAIAEK